MSGATAERLWTSLSVSSGASWVPGNPWIRGALLDAAELSAAFSADIGPSQVTVDGFFTLNPQMEDLRFLPRKYRAVVRISDGLRQLSSWFRPLLYLADSLYVDATRC